VSNSAEISTLQLVDSSDLRIGHPAARARAGVDSAPPPARPANWKRSVFHVSAGMSALVTILAVPSRGWLIAAAGALAAFAWTCEISRRISPAVNARLMRVFAPVAHANEHYEVNSSTWYVTALTLMALFAPMRAAEIGVIVLAFADPFAGVIGRRFGRTKIAANRTLEGSLGFVLAGTVTAFAWLAAAHGVTLASALLLAAAGAVAGAVAEVASSNRLDDNFSIPVASATAMAVAQSLLGA
jgi:dolichol kinase